MGNHSKKGFTLIELLIVVVIISILALSILFVLNPAETLRKARDAQRFSDLAVLKNAIAIYLTEKTTPYLGGAASNTTCKSSGAWAPNDRIYYSVATDVASITNGATLDGSALLQPSQVSYTASTTQVNGNGWIPVNLASITGGSPISNLPVDPTNTVAVTAAPAYTDKIYRYVCDSDSMVFEVDAVLESTAFTSDDNKMAKDGGDNSSYYEVGTNLNILGNHTDF
jgi:prepilin-type N-terminal cleavage/methylation domain-containing protein